MENKSLSFFTFCILLVGCSSQEQRQTSDNYVDGQREAKSEEYLLNKANEYYDNGRFDAAIILLDSLIEQDSSNGDYFFMRGYSKAQIGIREASTEDFFKAIELNFKVSKSYHNIGMNQVVLGNDSLALVCFQKALEADPFNARSKEMLDLLKRNE